MGDLLSSRWAPGGQNATYTQSTPNLRRPRSETPIRNNYNNTPSSINRGSSPNSNSRSRSRHLSRQPNLHSPSANTLTLPPHEELARFMKIVSRLRWKLPFLAEAYRLATLSPDVTEVSEIAHAEIMFKIDFHEYYALLERAIVHLLAIFNISVSSRSRIPTSSSFINGAGVGGASVHRYHANVLQALEEETTPLTPVLGSGKTIELLRQAKQLRNRWKTADMTAEEKERDPIGERGEVFPLSSYNFEEIIMGIFAGLEEGFVRASAHVELCRKPEDEAVRKVDTEDDWGFMVDAMDWEAV